MMIVRQGSMAPLILFGIVAVSLFGIALYYLTGSGDDATRIDPIVAPVERGEFVSLVLDQGEIQSSENVEIRCEVRAQTRSLSVIQVVPEGTLVKAGDFLVRLDSSAFEQDLESQKIVVANAETEVIQAEAALTTAIESLKEYEQGVFVENKKKIENDIYTAQSEIETAKQELNQARAIFEHSKKLQGKGFITKQQLEADGFNVSRAEFALKKAENLLELGKKQEEVLVNITQVKETVQLKSDIEAARVKLANEKESQKVEIAKKKDIEEQIKKCLITVPPGVEGQVVYAQESSRGGTDWVLEEGTTVRENQVLVRLPDPKKMEVKALINEQSITQIHKGMPVEIKVDALTNETLKGIVTKVNQYAEQSGWMSTSIRKYAVFVRIIDPPEALKPGMNASVSIQTRYEVDALKAPIQTIYAVQEKQFCLKKNGPNDFETREVQIDGDNSQVVLIKSGLEVGDLLVMNPGAYKEYMDLPDLELETRIDISDEDKSKIESEIAANQKSRAGMNSEEAETQRGEADRGAEDGSRRDAPGGGRRQGENGSRGGPRGGGPPGGGPPGGGMGGMTLPKDGASLIKDKDTDGDGKLSKDEAGSPYSFFFDRIDTNGDGLLDQSEADAAIKQMKDRMQGGGRAGGRGGGGGDRGDVGAGQ